MDGSQELGVAVKLLIAHDDEPHVLSTDPSWDVKTIWLKDWSTNSNEVGELSRLIWELKLLDDNTSNLSTNKIVELERVTPEMFGSFQEKVMFPCEVLVVPKFELLSDNADGPKSEMLL